MSEFWFVSVDGQTYGPYALERMKTFVAEGRILPHSRVVRQGEADAHPANEDSALAPLFPPTHDPKGAAANPKAPATPSSAQEFGRLTADSDGGPSHFIIFVDIKSGSIRGLEEEIFNMGPAFQLSSQVWLLTSNCSLTAVRNILVQTLGRLDALLIVNSTHDKATWHNFGPETDVRIRRIWDRIKTASG